MRKRFFTMFLFAAAAGWGAEVDPRGIFISSTAPSGGTVGAPATAPRPAVKLRIEMNQNGQSMPVSATHPFHTGDRFRFVFELSQSSHVYVVNRSIAGNPEGLRELLGTRGINVVNQTGAGGQAGAPKFQVLWPPAGSDAPLPARQTQSIPGATQFFEFDANPGIEKISVLVSPYPIDIAKYFNGVASRPRTSPAAGRHDDTNSDVLSQLEDLRSIDSNTTTDPGASRGICVGDCSQYSAPLHPGEPFIVTVDLLHSR
jgi:hypothetical protein